MGGRAWTHEEDALLVFFASIPVASKHIVSLLAFKGFPRTESAVRCRAQFIREREKLGRSWFWNINMVNQWLDGQILQHGIEHFFVATPQEQNYMAHNQPDIHLSQYYDFLNLRIMAIRQQIVEMSEGFY
ncbi:uncharacterized protein BJX67DRAFT_356708 [Aspergillus lucknowensis]|uniref:Myb-like domain-containing protein n=1 Tax=Aspergillus lucknowensis TaxID=176173 RepID=A0ABR4LNR9_9EURO